MSSAAWSGGAPSGISSAILPRSGFGLALNTFGAQAYLPFSYSLSQGIESSAIHFCASALLSNPLTYVFSPLGKATRTYQLGSAFNSTGSNIILGFVSAILALCGNGVCAARINLAKILRNVTARRAWGGRLHEPR